MKTALRSRSWSWVVLLALFVAGWLSAADVRVIISAGLASVYSELGSAFEKSTGHHVVTTRRPPSGEPGFSFAGAVTTNARQPEAAASLLRFLASADAAPIIAKAGLTPVSAR